jgi:hypothetical protein
MEEDEHKRFSRASLTKLESFSSQHKETAHLFVTFENCCDKEAESTGGCQ